MRDKIAVWYTPAETLKKAKMKELSKLKKTLTKNW